MKNCIIYLFLTTLIVTVFWGCSTPKKFENDHELITEDCWGSLLWHAYRNSKDYNPSSIFVVSLIINNIHQKEPILAGINYCGFPSDFVLYVYPNAFLHPPIKLPVKTSHANSSLYGGYLGEIYLDSKMINILSENSTILIKTSPNFIQVLSATDCVIDSTRRCMEFRPINWFYTP